MKLLRIGVFGSAAYDEGEDLVKAARIVGARIAQRGHIIVTGACKGLPHEAVKGAKSLQGHSIGFSAATTIENHLERMKTPPEDYNEIEYIPKNYAHRDDLLVCRKYRNVSSVAGCDIALFISGRWGTLNEFSIAFDMGKTMGVYTGGGKFSSKVEELLGYFSKPSKGIVLYEENPTELVDSAVRFHEESHVNI